MRSRVAWFVATALVCVATIGYLSAVRPRGKVGDARSDGVHYYRLAAQFHAGTTPTERVSLCYRIGIPFAVAWLAKALRIPIESAWALMNYLACAIFLSAFFVFALRFVEPPLAFLGTILFLLPYHVFVFLLCDHPFHVDLWFFALEAIGLLLISARRARTRRVLVALGALALLGGLIRESTLMIPACLLLASYRVRRVFSIEVLLGLPVRRSEPESRVLPHHELGEALVLVGWGVVGIMIARAVVDPMPRYLGSLPDLHANPGTPFSFVAVAAATLRTLGLTYYLNTLFTAFGPMLCLLVVRWQLVARHLGEEPFHVWMLLVALCFASCGGTDTVRFASWGSPVVHLLYLLALGSYWSDLRPCARSPGQLALLILAVSATLGGQLVCSFFFSLATSDALGLGRVLLQINLGQRECCLERFVLYACLTLGLALLLRHVEDHLRSGPGRSEQPRSPACFAESAL